MPTRRPDLYMLWVLLLAFFLTGCEDKMYECTRHDKEGNLKSIVPCNGKGVYMGEYLEYHKTGRLWKRKFFVDGLEEDTSRLFFYQTGDVLRETPMKQGKRHGESRTFRKDGSVEELITYREGFKDGPTTTYFESGIPRETFTYLEDDMSGPYLFFAPDSTLIVKGEFHNGVRYGLWEHYNYDGSLLATVNYYNNQKEGEFAVYRNEQLPYVNGEFSKGLLSGDIQYFDSRGNVLHSESWKDGRASSPPSRLASARTPGNGKAIFRLPDAAVYVMQDTIWVSQY